MPAVELRKPSVERTERFGFGAFSFFPPPPNKSLRRTGTVRYRTGKQNNVMQAKLTLCNRDLLVPMRKLEKLWRGSTAYLQTNMGMVSLVPFKLVGLDHVGSRIVISSFLLFLAEFNFKNILGVC